MNAIDQSPSLTFRDFVPFVLIAVAVALFTPGLMKFVVKMGHQIEQPEMGLDYLIAVVWAESWGPC